jgi:hypothetical protein
VLWADEAKSCSSAGSAARSSTSLEERIRHVCGWRGECSSAGRRAYATARKRTALGGDAVENLVDRGDELVDSLAFERGDDVVVVDADSVELVELALIHRSHVPIPARAMRTGVRSMRFPFIRARVLAISSTGQALTPRSSGGKLIVDASPGGVRVRVLEDVERVGARLHQELEPIMRAVVADDDGDRVRLLCPEERNP